MRRVLVAAGVLTALFGTCLQSHWDSQCQQQGYRLWDSDTWSCD